MATEKKKEVAKKLVVAEDKITDLALMTVEEGEEEHLTQEELELPFLRVAQKSSGQVDEDMPEFIKGLKPGQYFNTVSGEVYGDEIVIQVHGYFHNYIIWEGKKGSGTFSGAMTPEEFRKFESENSLNRDSGDMVQIVDGKALRYSDTRNFIVSLPEHEVDGIMIYPMSSSAIKPAKKWNTLNNGRRINGRPAKRYATLWNIKTAGFEKDGNSWKQTAQIKPLGWASPELVALGQEFESIVASIRNQGVRYSETSEATETEGDSEF